MAMVERENESERTVASESLKNRLNNVPTGARAVDEGNSERE